MIKVNLDEYSSTINELEQYPLRFINNNKVLKLVQNENSITIGTINETNPQIIEQLKSYHKHLKFTQVIINSGELTSYISKQERLHDIEIDTNIEENDLTRLANDAPVINLVNSIIIDGINKNASDIHIEGYSNKISLRYRVDGVLFESDNISRSLFPSISSRIKIMANLNIMEKRQPQDGRISVSLEGNNVDLRISIVPLSGGESIVLRLFIKKEKLITLEDLGYSGTNLDILNRVTNLPHGLILITGPTGSGKTTTLNALLQRINSSEKKIITIEDPVEYSVPGVNQIQVNNDIGLGFSGVLRRVLRQDPDVIMIGEIRDRETAELVVRASLTGHLVLSTLHTNDAPSAISRLKDLGIPDYLITSVLKGSFAQRLIRTTCVDCLGSGCKKCSHIGFKGRIAISEGFMMDEKLEAIILDGTNPYKIRNHLVSSGMIPLYDNALDIVNKNLTTLDEVERVIPH